MKRRCIRRGMWWFLIGVGLLIGAVAVIPPLGREAQRRQVEAAIARFEADPSQYTAEELALLLANSVPTSGQGERILRLVLNPTVTTRSAYPADRVPTVGIEWRFLLDSDLASWHDMYLTWKFSVRLEGQEAPTEHTMRVDILSYDPLLLRCGTRPLAIGAHNGQVCIDYALTRYEMYAPVWMRLKSLLRGRRLVGGTLRDVGSYKARFEIPVEIVVVEAADAEQVALVSNPKLDEAVRQSFTCRRQDGYPFAGAPRPVAYNGVTALTWKNVPIAVAFEPVLRFSDGREVLHLSHHVRGVGRFSTRAGGSGALSCPPFMTHFPLEVPGHYDATIVLKPDPNLAYDDPAIKAIWNGTLEFPISFSFTVDANEPRR